MIAQWLDTALAGFDYSILEFYHNAALQAGWILTPILKFFSIIGDNGYFSFIIAFILMLFKKTRKIGLCVLFSIGFGALITNVALKEIIARARPYQSEVVAFKEWWEAVKSSDVSGYSFPSGHVTAAMSSMAGLCIAVKKKWKWLIAPASLYVIIMMISRNYLMVHYPTDVIGGVIVGAIGAVAAYFTVKGIYSYIEKHSYICAFKYILNYDVTDAFKKHSKLDREKVR